VNEAPFNTAFVLPDDAILVPIRDIGEDLRIHLKYGAGDYALSRPHARNPTSVISANTAALLEIFRQPRSIVDAVIEYSTRESVDPEHTAEEAFEALTLFVNTGILVPAASGLARPIVASFEPGEKVHGYTIKCCVHVLIDTEVYCAEASDGSWVALKIARRGAEQRKRPEFAREARFLSLLDGCFAPRLLQFDQVDGLPFLALTWCMGVSLEQAVSSLSDNGSLGVLRLCEAIITAYSALHQRGVLHGDVHSGNVLAMSDGTVTILDYGLAASVNPTDPRDVRNRGGVDLFMSPECAGARAIGGPEPTYSPASEQYAIAALVYLLISGAHTHDFSLEEKPMLRQIAEEPPRLLSDRGVEGLGGVEAVLLRALSKEPNARHNSVADLGLAFAAVRTTGQRRRPQPARALDSRRLVEAVLERSDLTGSLFQKGFVAPTASFQNGAAGLAYALLRIAGIREDERLIAIADAWSARAQAEIHTETAFFDRDLGIEPYSVGHHSILHGVAGVHLVAGLIAGGRGDDLARDQAVRQLLASIDPTDGPLDVAFGRAGALLACTSMWDVVSAGDGEALGLMGTRLAHDLWEEMRCIPPIRQERVVNYSGAAHGWAGMLHAILRWTDVRGELPPDGLSERLDQLADLAMPAGRGVVWPRANGYSGHELAASWCNGAAGQVALWAAAADRYQEPRYSKLAELAGWTAYEGGPAGADLCCGWAGRSYALVELYRRGAGPEWLQRATTLCDRAAAGAGKSGRRDSLLKGEVGVALLAVELERPHEACMPLMNWR